MTKTSTGKGPQAGTGNSRRTFLKQGLVAGGAHPSPFPHCHVVTTTTHKTLRGPRGGLILEKADHVNTINKVNFPGNQGGPFMHIIAAKAVCFGEALRPSFKDYAAQIVANLTTHHPGLEQGLEQDALNQLSREVGHPLEVTQDERSGELSFVVVKPNTGEVAANTCGVDTERYKVQALVISAMCASLAGSLYAHFQSTVSPSPTMPSSVINSRTVRRK